MSKRIKQFTQEQIELLLQNPNIEDVTANRIKFTSEFKEKALQLNSEGISPTQIFRDYGIDIHIVGRDLPGNCLGNWKHARKIKKHNSSKYLSNQTKQNKALKAILEENRYLKAENEFLKKLRALQEIAEQE